MLDNPNPLASIRLLIVEPDQETVWQLNRMLAPHVAEIMFAGDGWEGFEAWCWGAPDVVLTEIGLDGIDGLVMSEKIRALDGDAVVIAMSPEHDAGQLHRIIELGIDGYVLKPIDPVILLDVIGRCVRDRQRVLDLKMARMVFEVANEGIMITDETTRILAVNPAFSEITGYRPDEVLGRKTRVLSSGLHNPDFYRAMWDSLLTHGRWSGEITNRRKDGSLFSEWLSIAAVDGETGPHRRFVGLVSDITERKQEEERIRRLAHFDSLTGLPNRVLFGDRLQRSLARARRYRHSLAVLYIDLDFFKRINDTWGHEAGDEVLRGVAQRMGLALRQSDTISRRGGDEFVAIIELSDYPEGLGGVCQKLLAEISRPIKYGLFDLQVSASMGIALYPADAGTADELLAAADVALYEAKADGRGRFRFFRPEAQQTICHRLDMERELREGLENWRYILHYLPEISLATGRVEHVEALLRFQHPEFGLLEAGHFLEVAEEIGIMPELGRKALVQATRELASIDGDIGLVVDLSARQLSHPEAVRHLLDILCEAGMPTERITFECTEAMLTGNELAMKSIASLAEAGCRFTLDDFGAGFCSFSLLSQLPMSSIKIDRSFISEIDQNPQIRELVAALIAFAQRLGLRAVAEGVETTAQLEILRSLGCDAAQGYLFGTPMTLDEWQATRSNSAMMK